MTISESSIKNASSNIKFQNGTLLDVQSKQDIANGISVLLSAIGDAVDGEGTAKTPTRVANMYDDLLSGYTVDTTELLNGALFEVEYDEMVVLKDIDFYSLCEHHLLPFYGKIHVGYLPDRQIIGLSKIPRLVEMFARRLQVQERMTQQIAAVMDELIKPIGVGVVVEAQHLCAAMRGVKKPNTVMTTSAVRGLFKRNPTTRDEFMGHVRHS
ncbi:MAG: GTP cyclohydrolase I FolE [Dehalococcoidia bacterium]|jgi:GTP cyclohydrolase I|nr:GTP cyclohydrolase I FolE [Chloroflexota bacterium]MDP7673401.1 GTP cyclohydrolase I FolE [Dehalococcoidia bacterium]|tara:strand:- start:6973 stop:7608 length:636 start_codon:yes stop_codon:yes gene_type:complete